MEPVHIADISRPRGEIIRIEITEYKGKNLLNIRTWYTDDTGNYAPTKKGVAIPVEQFEDLKNALLKAENIIRSPGG